MTQDNAIIFEYIDLALERIQHPEQKEVLQQKMKNIQERLGLSHKEIVEQVFSRVVKEDITDAE